MQAHLARQLDGHLADSRAVAVEGGAGHHLSPSPLGGARHCPLGVRTLRDSPPDLEEPTLPFDQRATHYFEAAAVPVAVTAWAMLHATAGDGLEWRKPKREEEERA